MNICIPVDEDKGLQSPVCQHFGSAPWFLIVDSVAGSATAVANTNQHHGHGMCRPIASLAGHNVDAVAVGGIGGGALSKLNKARIEVYLSNHRTVQETLDALNAGSLKHASPATACGHGRGQGQQHRHRRGHCHGQKP